MGAALGGRGPVSSPSYGKIGCTCTRGETIHVLSRACSVMASPIEVRLDVEDGIELAPVAGERASGAAESHEISSSHLESVRLLHEKHNNLSELQSAASDRVVEP